VPDDSLFTFKHEGERWLITKQNLLSSLGIVETSTGSRLISGSVTWISGLTFEVSACTYVIEGVTYESVPATITLDAADPDDPRIDVIFVDTDGFANDLTGTPAADPAKPEVDPLTQLELTFVTVAAGATEPEGVSATLLYDEDAGDPTEWDATKSASTIDLANADDPYSGAVAILFDSVFAGQQAILTAGVGNEVPVGAIDSLEVHVKAIVWPNPMRLRVAFYNGVTRVSNWVDIKDGNYGFDRTNTDDYQTVGIPNADFGFIDIVVDSLHIQANGGGGGLQALVDHIRVQTGLTVVNLFIGLSEEDLVNTPREFNAIQHFGEDELLDQANIAWNLDFSPCARVTLGGDRTLDFPAGLLRAGAYYGLRVIQDGTGGRTLAYGAGFKWPNDEDPELSTDPDAVDIMTFYCDGTFLYGAIVQGY
jgi:hypothetical protein